VVTVTSTVPADNRGVTAVIDVEELTVKAAAGVVPKSTAVAPDRFVPVIVTLVPPLAGPEVGLRAVTEGVALPELNVKWSEVPVADVPPSVVTVTSTVAATSKGLIAVIEVSEFTVNNKAGTVPKST
jgi:hypothetical protein